MNFEDAFKHYQDGTATDEEKEYVREQLDKAKGFSELFDDEGINVKPAPLAEADIAQVRKARKQFKWQHLLLPMLCMAIAIIIVGAILGGVFGAAAKYAETNIVYGRAESAQIAKNYAFSLVSDPNSPYNISFITSADDFYVDDIDKKFIYDNDNIKKSYYIYRIELNTRTGNFSIEIDVDTRYANRCMVHDVG